MAICIMNIKVVDQDPGIFDGSSFVLVFFCVDYN